MGLNSFMARSKEPPFNKKLSLYWLTAPYKVVSR